MGNCFFGAMSEPDAAIKVITSNGGIMEFSAPVTVSFITNESHSVPTTSYPALYRMSLDYQHHLKRSSMEAFSSRSSGTSSCNIGGGGGGGGSSRFWKVKLVITPEQLVDILAQEARTKELIESVRMVAKCGVSSGGISSSAAAMISDQWSLSTTSWSISSKIDALVGI
uniref:Uncharacterized protein n=1 Tax=Cajanus cajan TaxID=3821 RepID=A0A151U6G0_CAJCA|nr:hypothetical protein KK1_007541 [Cajanus cajan]